MQKGYKLQNRCDVCVCVSDINKSEVWGVLEIQSINRGMQGDREQESVSGMRCRLVNVWVCFLRLWRAGKKDSK